MDIFLVRRIDRESNVFEFPNKEQIVVGTTISLKLHFLVSVRLGRATSRQSDVFKLLLNSLLKQLHNLLAFRVLEPDL
jgi:hypothetical protein